MTYSTLTFILKNMKHRNRLWSSATDLKALKTGDLSLMCSSEWRLPVILLRHLTFHTTEQVIPPKQWGNSPGSIYSQKTHSHVNSMTSARYLIISRLTKKITITTSII